MNKASSGVDTKIAEAIRKYGEDNFSRSVLETVPITELDRAEIKWIAYYNSFQEGYNSTLGGAGYKRTILPDMQVILDLWNSQHGVYLISELLDIDHRLVTQILDLLGVPLEDRLNRWKESNLRKLGRSTHQYDSITGELLNTFPSLGSAALAVGVKKQTIYSCCRGKIKTASGYLWKYAD